MEITAPQISLTGSQISSSTAGEGDANSVIVTAAENLELNNTTVESAVETNAVGNAGSVELTAPSIAITNNSSLATTTAGKSEAGTGKVTVIADENIFINDSSASSAIETEGEGEEAGIVEVKAKQIALSDAELSSSTAGIGNANSVIIEAQENLSLNNTIVSSAVEPIGVGNAGNVQLTAPSLAITDDSIVSTATNGEGKAGTVTVKATNLEATNGSQLRTSTATSFEAGSIILEVSENINLSGDNSGIFANTTSNSTGRGGSILTQNFTPNRIIVEQGAAIAVNSEGTGEAGSINLQTEELTLDNGAINLSTDVAGDAGDLTITTPNLSLSNGGNITAQTSGEGKAGDIFLEVRENINLSDDNSGIFANTADNSRGKGGSILTQNFTPNRILVQSGAAIAVNSEGTGEAGSINLQTEELTLDNGAINLSTDVAGDAGDLIITTPNLTLRNGGNITAQTSGEGKAGDIFLEVRENMSLTGDNSGIFANTADNSTGEGGSILTQNFTPNRILVQSGAAIAVNSQGKGEGGDIKLEAGLLTLDRGSIDATTASNQGGNVTLTLTERLNLRNNSQITATAGTELAGGDGGNINIDAPFIIAVPQEDSDITANAFEGNGGNINITSQGIFGIEFREQNTILSDITASSQFGQQGVVEIDNSAVDPTRGLNNLPQQATETEVAQSCQANNSQTTLEFFDIGRGGLPPTPEDLLSSETIIAEWIPLNLETPIELSSNNSELGISNVDFVKIFSCQQ